MEKKIRKIADESVIGICEFIALKQINELLNNSQTSIAFELKCDDDSGIYSLKLDEKFSFEVLSHVWERVRLELEDSKIDHKIINETSIKHMDKGVKIFSPQVMIIELLVRQVFKRNKKIKN